MMTEYYSYVRPKSPNAPWRLEKLPLNDGNGIDVLTNSSSDLKSGKFIAFDRKDTGNLSISMDDKGLIKLPEGKYLVQFTSTVELPVAGQITISINNYPIYTYVQASTPMTISGSTVITSDGSKSFGVRNEGKEPIRLSNSTLIVTRLK